MDSKTLKNKPVVITSLDEMDGTINSILGYASGASSVRFKNSFLQEHMSPLLEQILQDTYGGRKYYVKQYEVLDSGSLSIDSNYDMFHRLLDYLAERKLTGNSARQAVSDCIEKFRSCDQVWLARILDGNLRIGAGDTFAKNTGKVEDYSCALANVLEKTKNVDILDGTWLVSRKLDGCRLHAHIDIDKNTVSFKSRQGKVFTTLDNLKQPVLDFIKSSPELGLRGKWVLDGEVCLITNDKEDFAGLMSVIRRKNYTIEHPHYKLFDLITEDEFQGKAESPNFSVRYDMLKMLASNYDNPTISVLKQQRITDPETLNAWQQLREQFNWEGLMVRKDVPYEGKRTNNLLKIKPFRDDEYVVTGIIEGDITYNTTSGSEIIHGVSALTIEHKGNVVKVGSGLTRAQREAWVVNPSLIIGKTINVQYFEETVDKKTGEYSLRFPTLKYIYEHERDT